MKIKRTESNIGYGKVDGYLVRIDCPKEKGNLIAEAITAVLIVAGICGWLLFL